MNSELQTGEDETRSTVARDEWAADRKSSEFLQSRALKENNNKFNTDISRKIASQDDKKTSSKKQDLLFPKWNKYLEDNDEDSEDLLCVVRQFCLEKPVTMATDSYNHVKLC